MIRLHQILNPLHRRGGYAAPHAALVALVAIIAFALGFGTGARYDAAYFHRYSVAHELKPPHIAAIIPALPRSLPRGAGSIDIVHYPAVGDQGQEGACAGWSTAWDVSYDYRMTHLSTHPGLKFSPCWIYNLYSLQYSNGQDQGSWPDQLVTYWAQGVPLYNKVPCPSPIQPVSNYGTIAATNAAKFKLSLSVSDLYYNPAQTVNAAASATIKQVVASGQPALVSLNVTPEYDNATQTGGLIWDHGVQSSRGGHENVALAYDDAKIFPNGDVGGAELQNQWTKNWATSGRAWVSYAWINRNVWAVERVNGP